MGKYEYEIQLITHRTTTLKDQAGDKKNGKDKKTQYFQ